MRQFMDEVSNHCKEYEMYLQNINKKNVYTFKISFLISKEIASAVKSFAESINNQSFVHVMCCDSIVY